MHKPLDILQEYWGYPDFRPLQADIIHSVLAGKDTLALLPTGGGKSICFQVPALCMEGLTLVVSPLIALMKDQVMQLKKRGIAAEAIFSGLAYRDIDRILDNAAHGQYKLLYVSPERLKTELFIERFKRMDINLIAVDEAHCISQWGYDFRPAYLEIADIREYKPDVNIIALTATATPEVVTDIQAQLCFKDSAFFEKSFERSNLSYSVLEEEDKEKKLIDIVRRVPGSAVVYVRNRKRTKELAYLLNRAGISADFYHAGIANELKDKKQADWTQNRTRVIVSTNAFGMGIDKPDVRLVVHMDLPDSLEAYFQEAGRAGRDGKKSFAVLLYHTNDKKNLERNFESSYPSFMEIRKTYRALGSYFQLATGSGLGQSFDFDIVAFANTYQLKLITVHHSLLLLEKEGWITMSDAIFVPSSIKIKVHKDELYDFQLKNPNLDPVLKTLLRTCHGAFSHYVNIRESQLANFLKMPTGEFTNKLIFLQKKGILYYSPKKDKPQLIFTQERIPADSLGLDTKSYNQRKKAHKKRIQNAVLYAEKVQCRSQLLLAYFGQKDAPKCGICDVCTGRTSAEVTTEEFETYKEKITLLLEKEPLGLQDIITSFHPKKENKVIVTINYLLEEELLILQDDKYTLA